jgi:restriction system protein
MSIPDFQSIMLPLLRFLSDGGEHSLQQAVDFLADGYKLTPEELNALIPSGKQTTFYNRVGWARTYLAKSGLIEMPRRSFFRISERGREILKQNPAKIDMRYLERFPEYIEFKTRKKPPDINVSEKGSTEKRTPEEVLDDALSRNPRESCPRHFDPCEKL